jgi:hypothetical protein
MSTIKKSGTRVGAAAVLAALVLSAAITGIAVATTVYSNSFASQAQFNQIVRSGGGKHCDHNYRAKSKTMHVSVHGGPATCSFRPPVQGDSELPDHIVRVQGKILKKTPSSARGGAFIEIEVRAGGGGVAYSLIVFPEKHKFELLRGPKGGREFPVRGKNKAIKGVNKPNVIQLSAVGAKLIATVNGKQVATATDSDPGQVTGRKVRFGIGTAKNSSKDVIAVVKRVSLAVPTP